MRSNIGLLRLRYTAVYCLGILLLLLFLPLVRLEDSAANTAVGEMNSLIYLTTDNMNDILKTAQVDVYFNL